MGSKWGCGDDGGGFSAHGAALSGSDRGRAHESPGFPRARKDFRDAVVSGDGCGDGETVPGPAAGVRARRTESVWGGGRRGATYVHLKAAKKGSVQRALTAAWRNTAPKRLAEKFEMSARGQGRV